ncbi:MAG: hypothetical protein LBR68_02900 [Lachnoclostridium sp.]|jgi:hypothetical protein|nr:hypothetical protein [Lachnoclostridium sp.]
MNRSIKIITSIIVTLFFTIIIVNIPIWRNKYSSSNESGKKKGGSEYLGLDNGKQTLNCRQIDDYSKLLHLDVDMPAIENLYYGNGIYMAVNEAGEVYVSDDLYYQNREFHWHKSNNIMKKDSRVITDTKNGFVIIQNGSVFITKNGMNWTRIANAENFISLKSDIVFFKNRILSYDSSYKSSKTINLNGYSIAKVKAPKNMKKVVSDSEVLMAITSAKGEVGIITSYDGVIWDKADVKLSESTDMSVGDIRILPNVNGESLIEYSYYYSLPRYDYYSYEINNSQEVIFTKIEFYDISKEKKDYNLLSFSVPQRIYDENDYDIKTYNKNFNLSKRALNEAVQYQYTSSLDKGNYGFVFEENDFQMDMVLLQDFMSDTSRPRIKGKVLNNRIYILGKYGGIIEIDDQLNQRWTGLYPRDNLTREEMTNPEVGEKLGIIEKEGVLWYANSYFLGNYSYYKVYSSNDGKTWKYQFSKKEKVTVEELKNEKEQ